MTAARFLVGDVFEQLAGLPPASVDLVMTSPPFLGLREYLPDGHPDKGKEIGGDVTPAEFVATLLEVTAACGRVLAPHGSICIELGDTYCSRGGTGDQRETTGNRSDLVRRPGRSTRGGEDWPLEKSLCFIPELFGASLAYGRNLLRPEQVVERWRVRNFVAWVKPNPPVGALGDKVRPATSFLTWATRSARRWFDLDPVRGEYAARKLVMGKVDGRDAARAKVGLSSGTGNGPNNPQGAPPLDWWEIAPANYEGSHDAVFPVELCRVPIESSCPRRVCRTCGEPSRRQVEKLRPIDADDSQRVKHANGERPHPGRLDRAPEVGWQIETRTIGWTTCGCAGTDGIRLDGFHRGAGWRPGVVLDPFAGTGTTGLAATGRGREAILIDLDERNVDLARERIGMFLEVG